MSEHEILDIVGGKIQYYRKLKKFTQETFAEKVGLTKDAISNIERGKSQARIESLVKISEALGVEIYELFIPDAIASNNSKRHRVTQIAKLLMDQDDRLIEYTHQHVKHLIKFRYDNGGL
jgi:transcriptional regulator with XRE-family HTH domain